MSLFKNMFGSSEPKEEKVLPWIPLDSINQLEIIAEKSKTKPQLIFKHSTRCGISRMVMNQFINQYVNDHNQVNLIGFNSNTFDLQFLRNLLIRYGINPYFFGKTKINTYPLKDLKYFLPNL